MALRAWLQFLPDVPPETRVCVLDLLRGVGIDPQPCTPGAAGIVVFAHIDLSIVDELRSLSRRSTILAICVSPSRPTAAEMWSAMHAGTADLLVWPQVPEAADQVISRLERWEAVRTMVDSPRVSQVLVGQSRAWRELIRGVAEVAAFTQLSVLITGESGTGKELIARLIHDLDQRPDKGDLVVVDCTTITPELSGSEFFGHERGAFTGAVSARDGAFALANGGTLFLDEIGELPASLQAQLLRVIQEQKFKRVGSNGWQQTRFRLVCATNRDLQQGVASGNFRSDLYFRIAGWCCRASPLRERRDDILPLVTHFLSEDKLHGSPPPLDDLVREYLLTREYRGNVRDLRRVVARLHSRHVGPGPITIGDVPEDERPTASTSLEWSDGGFESAIRHAIDLRVGLREIAQAAAEAAINLALEQEGGSLHRAASRLGVTDRALQMRRANRRPGK